ncbi:protein transport protein SEC31 [Chloropicon primus]|nr:protein transport protein SEC31 [Chloropicon primus]
MTPAPLGRVERSATFAFCPKACAKEGGAMGQLAAGTVAGAFDMSFSTTATVELFSLNPSTGGGQANVLQKNGVEAESHERFHRLVWGALPGAESEYPLGVIAGGLVDGSVNLFNPDKLFSAEDAESALICPLKKHKGAVKGLQFNPFSGNLLASGGEDGDVCIWDVANPTKPSLFPALKDSGMQKGEITALSWNHKVQHILASTTSSGSTIVWDLKRQRQVISFSDSSGGNVGKRCSALQWHPEIATQLIVASDDDRFPTLQVWDLRNSISPCREFKGHDKGVLSLAWSDLDPSLLLSTGKDNRTLLWDAYAGEVLSEMPRSQNWNFDAQWCPTVPGWFATASFDGVVSVYDVVQGMGAGQPQESASGGEFDFSGQQQQSAGGALNLAVAKRAPNWMGRPCGAAFGFGGKVISFSKNPVQQAGGANQQQAPATTSKSSTVRISSVPGDDSLANYASELTQLAADSSKDAMLSFCQKKGDASASTQEKELWEFMKILFEGDTRKQLLEHLGYKPQTEEEEAPAEQADANGLVNPAGNLSLDGNLDEINQQLAQPEAFNDEDFFDNLQGVPSPLPSPAPKKEEAAAASPEESKPEETEQVAGEELDDIDREIKHALFVGNYGEAVNVCLKADKMADALMIASVGGADLWAKTQKAYLSKNSKGYMKVLLSIMENDLKALVQQQHPQAWRETLALLCTYAQSEDWPDLCSNLGDLLLTRGGDIDSAVLCYICAGNLDNAVRLWSQSIDLSQDKAQLHTVMEKAIVLSLATEQQASQAYGDLLSMYADLLASNGQIDVALSFLGGVPGEPSDTILLERLQASATQAASQSQATSYDTGAGYGSQESQQNASSGQSYDYNNYNGGGNAGYYGGSEGAYSQQQQYGQASGGAYGQGGGGGYSQGATGGYSQGSAGAYGQANATGGYGQYQQPQQTQQASYSDYNAGGAVQASYGAGAEQAYQQPQQAYQQPQQPQLFNPVAPPAAAAAPAPAPTQFVPPQAAQAAATPASPPPAAPAPASPPPNISIETADVSKVDQQLQSAVAVLKESYQVCARALEGNPGKKREVQDNSRRIGILFWKLNNGDVKPSVKSALQEIAKALAGRDFATASKIHISLTTSDFDECGVWLTALKRIIKTRQQLNL